MNNLLIWSLSLILNFGSHAFAGFPDYGMGALVIGRFDGYSLFYQCSGNLIGNENWVVTAGHCVNDLSSSKDVIFLAPDLKTQYKAKSAYWILEKTSSGPEMNFRDTDFALVEVEKVNTDGADHHTVPQPIDVREMNALSSDVLRQTLISTKLQSSEDLVRPLRIQPNYLVISPETSSLIFKGDSGSAIMTESHNIVAVFTRGMFEKVPSFWTRLIFNPKPEQTAAFLVPAGLCHFAQQIKETKIRLTDSSKMSLGWLEAYSNSCSELRSAPILSPFNKIEFVKP